MSQDNLIIMAGDLVFCSPKSILGSLIRWAGRRRGEEKTYASHTAGIGTENNVVEALSRVVSTPWRKWELKHKRFEIWRYTPFSEEDRQYVATRAELYLKEKYGWWKIGAHLGDSLIAKVTGKETYCFRRMLGIKKYPICSWVWSWAYYNKGIELGSHPDYADPDSQHDFVVNDGSWEMVMKFQR